jgi:hypothetical protein
LNTGRRLLGVCLLASLLEARLGGDVSKYGDGILLSDEQPIHWLRLIRSENVSLALAST